MKKKYILAESSQTLTHIHTTHANLQLTMMITIITIIRTLTYVLCDAEPAL